MTTPARIAVKPPPLSRTLQYGMKGGDVKYVQTLLQAEGFFAGTPLGNFKKLTREAVLHFQNSHIGEKGKFLDADGEVGPKTWWALHNANGAAQRNFIPTEVGEKTLEKQPDGPRQKFLAKLYAMYASNIREVPNGSNYGDGVTALINACGFKFGIAWCMAAMSYAWKEANGEAPLGAMHVGCSLFWNEAKKRGMAHPKGTYRPIPGDIAVYNYAGGLRSNGTLSGSGHAAAVARISKDGKQFNALEGNIGNRFKHSIRNESERILVGYVNLLGDEKNPPKFQDGVTVAPVIAASYSDTR